MLTGKWDIPNPFWIVLKSLIRALIDSDEVFVARLAKKFSMVFCASEYYRLHSQKVSCSYLIF